MSEERWRSLVAQGWTTMLVVFMANLQMDTIRASVERKLLSFADHLGPQGIQIVLVVIAIYAVMPILVRTVSARPFMVVTVMLTFFIGLFVAAHEISHIVVNQDKPFGILHLLDLLHHTLVALVMFAGVMWFRAASRRIAMAQASAAANGPAVLHEAQTAAR